MMRSLMKLKVSLLRHSQRERVEEFLRIYGRSFNPDEGVSSRIIRRMMVPSPARPNPVHLWAAHEAGKMIGGACTVVFPAFGVAFGSYIFVDPPQRGRGLGVRILKEILREERRGPQGNNFRMYGEITASSGGPWHTALERAGFRFFRPMWPLASYGNPGTIVAGRLGYYAFRKSAPPRYSQPAFLAYVHALFYGPEAMHRHLLPRLKEFVDLEA
jgi:GNAT superfamily N-acetyltransferase